MISAVLILRIYSLFSLYFLCNAYHFQQLFNRKPVFTLHSSLSDEIDPNFEAHLPALLKVGRSDDRPSPDLALDLRKRYTQIVEVKRKAVVELKKTNTELAIEV